jgi:hypothetical protein
MLQVSGNDNNNVIMPGRGFDVRLHISIGGTQSEQRRSHARIHLFANKRVSINKIT